MSTEVTYSDLIADALKKENFQNEVYRSALEVTINRLDSQIKGVSEKELLKFIRELFSVSPNKHEQAVKEEYQENRSQNCLLKVFVEKAENLAKKDVDGSSDPYCQLAIMSNSQFHNFKNNKYAVKETPVIGSNLNPTWNETIELSLTRDQVKKGCLQIQVWDYDGESIEVKKVKGVRGIGRYMHEVAQSVAKKKNEDDKDDFMGFNSVPLANIPAEGLESWFKLRSSHTLQDVSGRIKVRLCLSTVQDESKERKVHSTDLIYAGLLRKIVMQAYNAYYTEMKRNVSCWNGTLSQCAKILLQEFEEQNRIETFTAAIVRWEVYAALHVQCPPGVDAAFMKRLLADLETDSYHAQHFQKSAQFTLDMLCSSIKMFIKEEEKKIAKHREIFSSKMENYVIALGNVLLVFKKLNSMGLYQIVRAVDPSLHSDVRSHIIEALLNGSASYYIALYERLLDESLEQEAVEEQDELDKALFGGTDIRVLIKLTNAIHKDLLIGKAVYHKIFLTILEIDYMGYVCQAIEKHLAADTNVTMVKVNQLVNQHVKETVHLQTKNSLLFRLYVAMRDLAAVVKKKEKQNTRLLTPTSPMKKIDTLRKGATEANGPPPITLHNYYDWFRPTLLQWVQMSKSNTFDVLKRAVEVDSVKRVDDIVKHSSSAVDTVACLTGHVVQFWRRLQWPDPVDSYTIALRLTDDIASASEMYADLIYKKLKAVGFFDDVGQFDVTEELCLTLNNLQYVKEYLNDLSTKMDFQGVADAINAQKDGLSGERVMATFTSLCSTSEIGMRKKIKSVTAGVGAQLKNEIRKFFRQFAHKLAQSHESNDHAHRDVDVRKKLEAQADDFIQPLMKYLGSNMETLHEWLCEPNFHRILEVLWVIIVGSMHKIVLYEFDEQKPEFFYQCCYIFESHIRDFFFADGNGMSQSKMNSPDCALLDSELKMRSAKTKDLVKLFYMQMYAEQERLETKLPYGYLNVYAWYDELDDIVNVEVVSANNLVPLDLNGRSDPFVQLRLAPTMLFRNGRSHQTLVEKKTLNPVWTDESFTFEVERSLAEEEGTVIIFTVLDHDVLSSNDLEGEAVLPLNMLEGVKQSRSGKKISRQFKLPLTQPQKITKSPTFKRKVHDENGNGIVNSKSSFSDVTLDAFGLDFESSLVVSPLYLLRARSGFDRDADEFYRWRRKLERAKEDQDKS